jgi:hypothetical protein
MDFGCSWLFSRCLVGGVGSCELGVGKETVRWFGGLEGDK